MKISYQKLEEIFKRIDYPKEKLDKFNKVFAQNFFAKLGNKTQNQLTEEQKQKLSELISNENSNVENISEYLKSLNLENELKKNVEQIINEMLNYALEQVVKYATPEEAIIINKVLED